MENKKSYKSWLNLYKNSSYDNSIRAIRMEESLLTEDERLLFNFDDETLISDLKKKIPDLIEVSIKNNPEFMENHRKLLKSVERHKAIPFEFVPKEQLINIMDEIASYYWISFSKYPGTKEYFIDTDVIFHIVKKDPHFQNNFISVFYKS